MTRHVSAAVLASYREGQAGRRRTARISAHLASCTRCAAVNTDLVAVTAMLADVQAPPIPDQLAARLQSALAAESAQRAVSAVGREASAAGPDIASGAAQLPGRPDLPERARRRRLPRLPALPAPLVLRVLAGTAAAAVLAGGGYLYATNRSTSAQSSPATGGAPVARPVHSAVRGENAGFAARGPIALPYRRGTALATTSAVSSSLNFTLAGLHSQVRREVARRDSYGPLGNTPPTSSSPGPQPASHSPVAGATSTGSVGGVDVATLGACVSRVAAGADVLLVEVARYEGAPATIIIAAKSAKAKTLDVSVVGRSCSASQSDIVLQVTIPAS